MLYFISRTIFWEALAVCQFRVNKSFTVLGAASRAGLFVLSLCFSTSPALSLDGDETRFTINAAPSFELVAQDKQDLYKNAQAHGFCQDVLELEQEGLVRARPEFKSRFAVGTELSPVDQTALEIFALGYRRCQALKYLSKVLAVPRLKAGFAPYAPLSPLSIKKFKKSDTRFTHFAPKPRLGIFFKKNSPALNKLIQDRSNPKGLDRPLDWAKAPMPLDDEILLHTAFTDLVVLAVCHSYNEAYKDLGKFYDVGFSILNPFVNFAIFHEAAFLNIAAPSMKRRLADVRVQLPLAIALELDEQGTSRQLHKHPRLTGLFELCGAY